MSAGFSTELFKYNQFNNNAFSSPQVSDNSNSNSVQNDRSASIFGGDNKVDKTGKSGGDNKTSSIFDAFKKGNAAQMKANQTKIGDQAQKMKGKNAFGDNGFGDTFSFTTKAEKDQSMQVGTASAVAPQTFSNTGFKTADNQEEIQRIADELGCEATEDAVKQELDSMSAEELMKLDSSIIDDASDIGVLDKSDVEKKLGYDQKEVDLAKASQDKKQKPQQMGFGSLAAQQKPQMAFGSATSAGNFGMIAANANPQQANKSFMNKPNPEDMKKLKLSGFSMGAEV